jgi:hypothetical protein
MSNTLLPEAPCRGAWPAVDHGAHQARARRGRRRAREPPGQSTCRPRRRPPSRPHACAPSEGLSEGRTGGWSGTMVDQPLRLFEGETPTATKASSARDSNREGQRLSCFAFLSSRPAGSWLSRLPPRASTRIPRRLIIISDWSFISPEMRLPRPSNVDTRGEGVILAA